MQGLDFKSMNFILNLLFNHCLHNIIVDKSMLYYIEVAWNEMFLKILLLSHITLYVFIMILHGVYFICFSLMFYLP
jgi:hypothetical protein